MAARKGKDKGIGKRGFV